MDLEFKMSKEKSNLNMWREIFITGKTQMGCLWLMLIVGLVFGFFIRGCGK
jgi:hypothetical protein